MKPLEYFQILKLAKEVLKEVLDDYKVWGDDEIMSIPPKNRKDTKQAETVFKKHSAYCCKEVSEEKLELLKKEVKKCRKCGLGEKRLNAVFGEGSADADLMFVGEGPGFEEDHKGIPFIGRAGQLLTKIIEAMGFNRETVYIANIVKCHPMIDPSDPEKRANDRPPTPDESGICKQYLDEQIKTIAPKVIVTLGSPSSKTLLNSIETITALRGNFRDYNGTKLMPTYHPAALLRNPNLKKFVWEDMKKVMAFLKEHSYLR
jgi:DNA polymerase